MSNAQPDLEGKLAEQIAAAGLPAPQRQSHTPWSHTNRRFAGDFYWPEQQLLVEVEGGAFVRGRHVSGAGFEADCVRQNLAILGGSRVIRVTGRHVRDGSALSWITAALGLGETQAGFSPPKKKKRKRAS